MLSLSDQAISYFCLKANVDKAKSALMQRRGRGFTISVNHEVLNMSFSPSGTAGGTAGDGASEAELTNPDVSVDPVSELIDSIETDRRDSFVALGSAFLTRLPATPLPAPYLVGFSADTAAELGFNVGLDSTLAQDLAFIDYFTGNTTRDLPADEL